MYNSPRITVQHLTQVIAIGAGGFHTVVARRDGTVWTWGRSDAGQLGTGRVQGRGSYSSVPVQVPALTHVSAVAAGGKHTLALRRDGTVWAWGANDYAQLGRGQHTLGEESTARPMRVLGLTDVQAIVAGRAHNVVVRRDRTVWAWGINGYMVATGDNHAIALTGAGAVKTWGWNNFGQLGNGEEGTLYYLPQDE